MRGKKLLAVSMSLLLLTSCGGAENFERQVKNGDYEKAIETYTRHIAGNSEKEYEAMTFLSEFISENMESYKNGALEEDKMQGILNCYGKLDESLGLMLTDLRDVAAQFDEIQTSRENYDKALEAMEEEDYPEALEYLYSVSACDSLNYDAAAEKIKEAEAAYCTQIIERADEFLEENDYEDAYLVLEEGEEILCEYDPYVTYCTDMKDEWVDDVLERAEESFGDDKDYEAAISDLHDICFYDDRIEEAISYYQEYVPVLMTDMDYTKKQRYIQVGCSSADTDVNQNTYNEDSVIAPSGGSLNSEVANSDDESYVTYYLNADYSTLTGIVYRTERSLSAYDSDWTTDTVAKIYGDEVLLYEAPVITQNTYDSYPFTVDVTGVRELKIVMRGVYEKESGWVGMYTRGPRIAMAEMYLQK